MVPRNDITGSFRRLLWRFSTAALMRERHGRALPVRGADTVTVPGGVRGWKMLRDFGARLSWARTLGPAQRAAADGVPVAESLARHIADPENTDLHDVEDFAGVFRPGGVGLGVADRLVQPRLANTLAALCADGPDAFYTGDLAESMVDYLRSRGSCLTAEDFADYLPEDSAPLSVPFGDLRVWTSPPNTHGFLMLRALRAIHEMGLTDPLGSDLGELMRIFHHGNRLRAERLADPRQVQVDCGSLVDDGLAEWSVTGEYADPVAVPHGDTVGIAAADSAGYSVSLIQSVYHAFGSGLIDPRTGILFHNRGTSFSLDDDSPNVLAPRKRPAHTLMPAMTTRGGEVRHVLATMGGQGQPQILTQVLLHALAGSSVSAAVAAPRAIVGLQADGNTIDTVNVEFGLGATARNSVLGRGLNVHEVPAHTEFMGQTNVVFVDRAAMTAASDPRSDGAGMVGHFPRHPLA